MDRNKHERLPIELDMQGPSPKKTEETEEKWGKKWHVNLWQMKWLQNIGNVQELVSAYRPQNNSNIFNFFIKLLFILNKNFETWRGPKAEKQNNFKDTFSHTNLVNGHICFQKC